MPLPRVPCTARLVSRDEYRNYDFGPQHPLTPRRLEAALDLLREAGLGPIQEEWFEPPAAGDAELQRVHSPAYVDAVRRLSLFADDRMAFGEAVRWGLGPGDTPAFVGMHEAAAAIAGGTLHAIAGVLSGQFQHAFNPMGGLHHAMRERASGFCIYNDPAVGIAAALHHRAELRVLYLDFDAHHGDGVQAAFYADRRVLTFSIHETGRYLFPGSGSTHELGEGPGRGYSLNLPVEPFTEDGSWIESIEAIVPELGRRFRPDLVVSQHGCDSHAWDPLTHLALSTRAYATQAGLVHALAHRYAEGRWVALGGGGYDWVRVVPRSWGIVWAEMSARPLPETLPAAWCERWNPVGVAHGFAPMPRGFLDDTDRWPAVARRDEIERENRRRVEAVRALLPPAREPS